MLQGLVEYCEFSLFRVSCLELSSKLGVCAGLCCCCVAVYIEELHHSSSPALQSWDVVLELGCWDPEEEIPGSAHCISGRN